MALSREPKLIVADEPTTALDVTVQAQVIQLLLRLRAELGFALILVSHDLALVADVTDRVVVMYGGQIVETGVTADLVGAPAHHYARGLLGSVLSLESGAERLTQIRGVVPSPADFPAGCRFADRCPMATEVCRTRHRPGELTGRAFGSTMVALPPSALVVLEPLENGGDCDDGDGRSKLSRRHVVHRGALRRPVQPRPGLRADRGRPDRRAPARPSASSASPAAGSPRWRRSSSAPAADRGHGLVPGPGHLVDEPARAPRARSAPEPGWSSRTRRRR